MIITWSECSKADVLTLFLESPELALDTETTGLDETDRLFCVTISNAEQQLYLERAELRELQELWDDPTKIWHLQNAKFDMRMLRYEGVELAGRISELTVMARLVRNDHMKYNLKYLSSREGILKLDIVEKEVAEKKLFEYRKKRIGPPEKALRFDWVNRGILKTYACVDAHNTFVLAQKYKSQFTETDGNHWRVWNNEVELTKVCFEMERRGVCIDVKKTQDAFEFEHKKCESLKAEFQKQLGVEYVDSPKTFLPIFQARGHKINYTNKDNASFTGEILEKYDDPVANMILDIRGSSKLLNTYYTNYINMYVPKKDLPYSLGVIHPNMWPGGTRTGRFSYSDPNFQNLPKDEDVVDESQHLVRACIVPRPGNVLVAFDFKAQEYRLMLDYANEKRMIDAVMGGADVHQATADLLGLTRYDAKQLNFAYLYGAGDQKLGRMMGKTTAEARKFRDLYEFKLPKVARFIDEVIRRGRARGFVYNWMGRRLYADKNFAYALPNHIIQGGCADVVKLAMNRIGVDVPMILQIHDELVFDVPEEKMDELYHYVKPIMENAYEGLNGMKLLVDAKWSKKSFAARDMEELCP